MEQFLFKNYFINKHFASFIFKFTVKCPQWFSTWTRYCNVIKAARLGQYYRDEFSTKSHANFRAISIFDRQIHYSFMRDSWKRSHELINTKKPMWCNDSWILNELMRLNISYRYSRWLAKNISIYALPSYDFDKIKP